jgi:hypothetical protein
MTCRLFVAARIAPCSESALLAVRHACEVVEPDGIWRESFAPGSFLARSTPAPVTLSHDGETVGFVFSVISHAGWHLADLVLEVNAAQRELVRVGQAVSIDARSVRRDDNELSQTRRHRLATLDSVAILRDGERPWYDGARIVGVREQPEREPARSYATSFGGYPLREGDVAIDHAAGVAFRFERGKLVPVGLPANV